MEIVLPTSGSGGSGGGGGGGASAAFRASSTASAAAGTHCVVGLEPQLLPLVACISAAMQTALAPLQITSLYSSSPNHWLPVVDRLTEISRHREYNAIVTEPVRVSAFVACTAQCLRCSCLPVAAMPLFASPEGARDTHARQVCAISFWRCLYRVLWSLNT